MFNFLWRVKRVEFAITGAWRRAATGARGVLAGVDDVLGADWKKVRVGCAEMIHFLVQLQYYILFEVPPTNPILLFNFSFLSVYFEGICGKTLMVGD